MKTIAVVGAKGKMGSEVCKSLEGIYKLVKIDKGEPSLEKAGKLDLVVDFSTHENSAVCAKFCAEHGVKLIVGSTGQTDEELLAIFKTAKVVPVLKAGNFSVGIHLLKKALTDILKQTHADVTIFEKHHSDKLDSPSGTALEIAYIASEVSEREPQILSLRGGREIGTHSAYVYFGDEVLKIEHQAFSRKAFADGVKIAADYLLKQSEAKLYFFDDIFNV